MRIVMSLGTKGYWAMLQASVYYVIFYLDPLQERSVPGS